MAIKIGQEFERTSKATRFKDDVLTKSQMLSGTDDNYSDGYLVVEKDSHDLYIYDSNATPSAETGKFVKSSGSGGGGEVPTLEQVLTKGDTATDKQIKLDKTPNVDTSLKFSKISGDGIQTHAEMDYKNRTCYNSLYPHMFYIGSTRPGHQGEYTALRIDTGNYDDTKVEMTGDMKDAWKQALEINEYTLQPATTTTLGGVKVGSNLTITNNGVLSADKVVEEFNSNTGYGYSDIARACRRNVVYISDGTDKRKPVVFFELNDSTSTAILYTAEKNGFTAYKWNSTEYVGKTTLTTIPNGGTTGQVLAKKSDTDQDFDWETIVSDGWGIAKAGSVTLTSTSGSHIPFQIIDITDLGLTSTSDYEILVTAEAQRSTAYKVENVFANKISETQFEIGFYTPSQDGLTINLSYIVVAKGFQSIMGGGSGTLSSGFGLTLNNNEISLTKCAVESVISNGYTKFYDKNDQGALFKPSENGMRYVYGDMGAETGEEIELASKTYVDTEVAKKQNTLVSGTNIKTFNGESLLGSGDIPIPTIVGSDWGVAKAGVVPSVGTSATVSIDISELGLSSVDDYTVNLDIINGGEIYPAATLRIASRTATSFGIRNTSSTNVYGAVYTVFAKGYGSIPNGGTTGQALVKKSDTDGDVEWKTVSGGGASLTIDTTQVGYGEATVSEGGQNLSFTNQNGQGVHIGGISEDGEMVTSKSYVDSKSPTIVNEGATFTNAQGNQKMQIRTGGTNSVIIKDTNANGTTEYWSYELPDKDYVDTEVAKKGNAITTFDNEYKTLQIRDVSDSVEFQVVKETSNDYVRMNEYAKDDRGQMQQIFDVNLPTKSYVDSKVGVHMAVGAEKWYGTYTDENNVTYQTYTKTVYIPALPSAAGITTYQIGVSNMKQIISISGVTTDGFVLNAPRQNAQDNIAIYQVSKGSQTFSIEVGKDRSSKSAYVTIIYAKNN